MYIGIWVLPFGLDIAPRVFTNVKKPTLQELCLLGVGVLLYLTDWLIGGRTRSVYLRTTMITLVVLQR